MSLIHRALDQPNLPQGGQGSDYNPLSRKRKAINRFWWSLTLIAFLASLVVLGSHWLTKEPGMSVNTPATPALARKEPSLADPIEEPSAGNEPSAGTEPPAGGERSMVDQPTIEQDHPLIAQSPELAASADVIEEPVPEPGDTVDPAETSEPMPTNNQRGARSTSAVKPETPVKAAPALVSNDAQPATRASTTDQSDVAERAPEATQTRSAEVKQIETPSASQAPVRITRPGPEQRELAVQEALNRNQIQKAESLLTAWISESPRAVLPRVWLAKIHLSKHRFEVAESLLDGLTTVEALGLRGLLLEKTERYGKAAALFEHLARTEPENPQWWLHWAINQENNGRLAQARLLYQTYLEEFSAYNASLTAFASQRYQALEK